MSTTEPNAILPSTTAAIAAVAQSRNGAPAPAGPRGSFPGEGTRYRLGNYLYRALQTRPYERPANAPVYRPLRIFTLDPSASARDGAIAIVNVPYEPVAPGPVGRVFEVDPTDVDHRVRYREVNLDSPDVLIRNGRDASPSDPEFHQQMVYAVSVAVYAAFRTALGRDLGWGFESSGRPDEPLRLRLRPHGGNARNAFYDRQDGTITFGYYNADAVVVGAGNLPRGTVFTCLSHDIIVHEVTHALVDGLRVCFALPTGPDVFAFHESFADLVAVFQHFSYREVVEAAIRSAGGHLDRARPLFDIAAQFGHTTGAGGALRTALSEYEPGQPPRQYADAGDEPHQRGRVLTEAVFDAFATVYKRKIERYVRLATGGSGILPAGEISPDLRAVLADQASKLASQFLTICIRALDYCPPVDIEFGEFLRAVITADSDLVPDDPWGYREAWIQAFGRRGIYPRGVRSLSQDALLWRAPTRPIAPDAELSFAALRFDGDPGRAASRDELRRQACRLGALLTDPRYLEEFGLALDGDPRLQGDSVSIPRIESVRTSRRVGPDGQVVFDLVAEVTQSRQVRAASGNRTMQHYGGATIILDPNGALRYVVSKSVLNARRLQQHRDFVASDAGSRFWTEQDGALRPLRNAFRLLHPEAQP